MLEELSSMESRLDAVERRLAQAFRIGIVSRLYESRGAVRVVMPDADCIESHILPVLARKTHLDKDYWLPDIGEQVLCVFLPTGQETGFVIGSPWSEPDPPPVASADIRHIRFLDGTWLEYNRASGDMQVHCRGKITLAAAAGIEFKTPTVKTPYPIIIGPGMPVLKPVEPKKDTLPCPG